MRINVSIQNVLPFAIVGGERDGVEDVAAWPLKLALERSRRRDGVGDVAGVVYMYVRRLRVGKSNFIFSTSLV